MRDRHQKKKTANNKVLPKNALTSIPNAKPTPNVDAQKSAAVNEASPTNSRAPAHASIFKRLRLSKINDNWQAVILGIIYSAAVIALSIKTQKWIQGKEIDIWANVELAGNLALLFGIVITAMGAHLSSAERSALEDVSEGKGALDSKTVANLLLSASKYSSQGLFFLLLGTTLIVIKLFFHHA